MITCTLLCKFLCPGVQRFLPLKEQWPSPFILSKHQGFRVCVNTLRTSDIRTPSLPQLLTYCLHFRPLHDLPARHPHLHNSHVLKLYVCLTKAQDTSVRQGFLRCVSCSRR